MRSPWIVVMLLCAAPLTTLAQSNLPELDGEDAAAEPSEPPTAISRIGSRVVEVIPRIPTALAESVPFTSATGLSAVVGMVGMGLVLAAVAAVVWVAMFAAYSVLTPDQNAAVGATFYALFLTPWVFTWLLPLLLPALAAVDVAAVLVSTRDGGLHHVLVALVPMVLAVVAAAAVGALSVCAAVGFTAVIYSNSTPETVLYSAALGALYALPIGGLLLVGALAAAALTRTALLFGLRLMKPPDDEARTPPEPTAAPADG